MRASLSSILLALAACGGSQPLPARPLGAHDHLAEAERHDAAARDHDALAASAEVRRAEQPLICGDRALADQTTSGGERLMSTPPCWTSEAAAVERHRLAATRLRADAATHRGRARRLLATELGACVGLSQAETEHSPFDHREDITSITAELDGDRVRGARVRFASVPGLDARWMERALGCHRAQAAAIGYDDDFLPHCPSVVAGAETTVFEEDGALVVVIRAADPGAALVVYARAEALLAPAAAGPH